jgi:hypothetical protein
VTADRHMAPYGEGVGLVLPGRNPAHADPEWYQLDLDDPIEDPDAPFVDPLPTERHRTIPDAN